MSLPTWATARSPFGAIRIKPAGGGGLASAGGSTSVAAAGSGLADGNNRRGKAGGSTRAKSRGVPPAGGGAEQPEGRLDVGAIPAEGHQALYRTVGVNARRIRAEVRHILGAGRRDEG